MPPYRALQIANYFIRNSGGTLTPLQIIKLVYYAHGYHLALTEKPLLTETVQAWDYGPVVPSVYHGLKKFGAQKVPKEAFPNDGLMYAEPADANSRKILDRILEVFGPFSGGELSAMTHRPGTPWYIMTQEIKTFGETLPRGLEIPDQVLQDHFQRALKDAKRS